MKEILPDEELQRILDGVATTVEGKLKEVSTRTLEKLKEISPDIANAGGPGRLRRGACGPLQRELRRPDPGRLGGQERGQGGGPLHLHRLRVSGHGNGLREMKKPPQKGGD